MLTNVTLGLTQAVALRNEWEKKEKDYKRKIIWVFGVGMFTST